MNWKPVLECDDDENNPTVWATKVDHEKYGQFIWIEKHDDNEYHITVCPNKLWRTLKICKSLASAKRWCSSNVK